MKLNPWNRKAVVLISFFAFANIGRLAAQEFSARLGAAIFANNTPDYVGGNGNITTQGPTGLFINPSSGTLSAGSFAIMTCVFNQERAGFELDLNHDALIGYGLTDWFEVGAIGVYKDVPGIGRQTSGGPYGRLRIFKDEGWMPELSLVGSSQFGDVGLERSAAFLATYKRFPIDEHGFVRAIGIHGGLRHIWYDIAPDAGAGYGGIAIELPFNLKLIGEITSRENSERETPFALGIQWSGKGWGMSLAAIQDGEQDRPGFFFGVGALIGSSEDED